MQSPSRRAKPIRPDQFGRDFCVITLCELFVQGNADKDRQQTNDKRETKSGPPQTLLPSEPHSRDKLNEYEGADQDRNPRAVKIVVILKTACFDPMERGVVDKLNQPNDPHHQGETQAMEVFHTWRSFPAA